MNILTVNYLDAHAGEQFASSLHATGFGVIKNHPLDWQLIEEIYQEWLNFFDSDMKYRYAVSPETKGGFFSSEVSETAKGSSAKDLKEFFHIFTDGVYPDELTKSALTYYEQAKHLAMQLLAWIEQYSPPSVKALYNEPLPQMLEGSEKSLLRILRYPPLRGDRDTLSIRAAAHEDINLITILPAATAPGLQVKDKKDNWIDVPLEPGSLVINVGDMLQELSNGYYPSTTHRVINPVSDLQQVSRVSMPFFLQPRPDVRLSERYTAGSYHEERMRQLRGEVNGKVIN